MLTLPSTCPEMIQPLVLEVHAAVARFHLSLCWMFIFGFYLQELFRIFNLLGSPSLALFRYEFTCLHLFLIPVEAWNIELRGFQAG